MSNAWVGMSTENWLRMGPEWLGWLFGCHKRDGLGYVAVTGWLQVEEGLPGKVSQPETLVLTTNKLRSQKSTQALIVP